MGGKFRGQNEWWRRKAYADAGYSSHTSVEYEGGRPHLKSGVRHSTRMPGFNAFSCFTVRAKWSDPPSDMSSRSTLLHGSVGGGVQDRG